MKNFLKDMHKGIEIPLENAPIITRHKIDFILAHFGVNTGVALSLDSSINFRHDYIQLQRPYRFDTIKLSVTGSKKPIIDFTSTDACDFIAKYLVVKDWNKYAVKMGIEK